MKHASFTQRRWIGALAACALVVATSCSKTDPAAAQQTSASNAAPADQGAQQNAGPPGSVAAAPVTQASWSTDSLDELVAPIALYPDALVGQILAASINSQEVLDAGNWLLQNENLKGDELDKAAESAGFGPAMRSLVQFPTVVDMMCQQLDWTKQLGSAFSSDQKAVLDAIQRLRTQAQEVGNLKTTPQQTVETKTENGNTYIEVKPADPTIVYVPQYNPQVVYTTPPPAQTTTTTTTSSDTVSTDTAVAAGLLAFGVGILIGNSMNDHDDCYPHYGYGAVYYGPRPFYPPAYAYRPVYGPAFRPAYGYHPPNGYRNNYNNYNRNTNININNSNYYNRFNNNNNLKASNTRQANGQNWKGQSSYGGSSNNNLAQRPNQGAVGANNRPSAGGNAPARSQTYAGANRNNARVDRGYGDSGAGQNRAGSQQSRPATQQNRPGAQQSQPATQQNRQSPQSASSARGDNAFSGASKSGGGSFDRSASARGHASTSSRQSRSGGAAGRSRN